MTSLVYRLQPRGASSSVKRSRLPLTPELRGAIRAARSLKRLSQAELGQTLDPPRSVDAVNGWESQGSKVETIAIADLKAVARATGWSFDQWLQDSRPVSATFEIGFESLGSFGARDWPPELDDPELEELFDKPGFPAWVRGLTVGAPSPTTAIVAAYVAVDVAVKARRSLGAQIKPSWERFLNALRPHVPAEYR